jgi:hypothetical protein
MTAKWFFKVPFFFRRLLVHGVVDCIRAPQRAKEYWHQIASAAIRVPIGNDIKRELRKLPLANPEEVFPKLNEEPVSLIDYRYDYGDMPLTELMLVCRIARRLKPRLVFEIGTFLGGTTLQLAVNSSATVYTLDLPPAAVGDGSRRVWDAELDVYPDIPGRRFHDTPWFGKIKQVFGNSREFDFEPFRGQIDMVLVDGCHQYDFVLSDSVNALKLLSSKGIILWHDYAEYAPGVVQALEELGRMIALRRIEGTSLVVYFK